MTPQEFASYLNAGLGLAVIRLRREPDKSRFLEPFRHYIMTGKDCIQNHCFGYEDDLLACFEDTENVKAELLSALFSLASSVPPRSRRISVSTMKKAIGSSLPKS